MDLVWFLPEEEIKDVINRPHTVKKKVKHDKDERERWKAELQKKIEWFVYSGEEWARIDDDGLSIAAITDRTFLVIRDLPYDIRYRLRKGKLYLHYVGKEKPRRWMRDLGGTRIEKKWELEDGHRSPLWENECDLYEEDECDVDVAELLSGLRED